VQCKAGGHSFRFTRIDPTDNDFFDGSQLGMRSDLCVEGFDSAFFDRFIPMHFEDRAKPLVDLLLFFLVGDPQAKDLYRGDLAEFSI
jgi:hypothetical protein